MENYNIAEKLFTDSISLDAVLETVRDTNVRGYRNLWDIQTSLMGVRRIDIPLQNFKQIKRLPKEKQSYQYPWRYIYTIDVNMVVGEKEYQFRSSDLMNTPLSQMDISKNISVFKSNFIIYLDGKMLPLMTFLVTEDECSIVISLDTGTSENGYMNGLDRETFDKYYDENANLHVFVVPNYSMEYTDINRPTLELYSGDVRRDRFSNGGNFKTQATLAFMNVDTNDARMDFIQYTLLDNAITVPEELYQEDIARRRIYTITFDRELYDIKQVSKVDEWFILDSDYELPLPNTNILIFQKSKYGYTFNPNLKLEVYYPNVYHIVGMSNIDVFLFIFYADNTLDSKYRNDLTLYTLAMSNLIDKYRDNTIPEIVKTYEPIKMDLFNSQEFMSSVFFPDAKNVYSIAKLQEYFNEDPRLLTTYLYLKLGNTGKYSISMNKVNWTERTRLSTVGDYEGVGDLITFNEEHILLNLRKKFVGNGDMDFRVFIDNICMSPAYYTLTFSNDFYLFYIPKRLLTKNSVVEIEKYNEIKYTYEYTVTESTNTHEFIKDTAIEPVEIVIPDTIEKIDSYNINIVDEEGYFLDSGMYKLYCYEPILEEWIEISGDGHHILENKFYIVMPASYIGQKCRMIVDNSTVYFDVKFDHTQSVNYQPIVRVSRTRSENVRVFKNGLALPSSRFFINENTLTGSSADVAVASECTEEDSLAFDIVPIEIRLEYYLKEIEDPNGFVDTGDELSSPLDLKWYDIYLNGKKMNKSNIDIISSNKFFIQGTDSLKNLYIYKRQGINDSFSTKYENDINNRLLDNIDDLLDTLRDDREIIQDTAEDIISDVISDIFGHLMFVSKFLEFIHINPNIKQLTAVLRSEFPHLINEYGILTLLTNEELEAEEITTINSNIRREYMKKGQYRYAFTPLYIGNHEDAMENEYMCDPITGAPGMKTANGEVISSGFLTRLASHKDKFNVKLTNNAIYSATIYQIEMNDNTRVVEMTADTNVLDETVALGYPVKTCMLSLDLDVLVKGEDDVMMMSEYDPMIAVEFGLGDGNEETGVAETIINTTYKLSELNETPLTINGANVSVISIKINADESAPETVKYVLHSILIAF